MSRRATGVAVGAVLVVAGVLLLLQAMRVVTDANLPWTVLFVVSGLAFWYRFLAERVWWAAIPAGALLGLGLSGGIALVAPAQAGSWGGPAFLAALGVGFAAVSLRHHRVWWALIPAGVLLTLAAVAGLHPVVGDTGSGVLFFAGLAITFALVAALPPARQQWGWIPAAVLAALAILIAAQATALLDALSFAWPAALIVAGAILLWRTFVRPGEPPMEPGTGLSVSDRPHAPGGPSADGPCDDEAPGHTAGHTAGHAS